MDNLLTIQKQLQAVTNNPNKSKKLLKDLNNILTLMQKSLKSTIGRLEHLKSYIIDYINHDKDLKASNVVVSPKLLSECGEAITENNLYNDLMV